VRGALGLVEARTIALSIVIFKPGPFLIEFPSLADAPAGRK
jgi:hypothetical protein